MIKRNFIFILLLLSFTASFAQIDTTAKERISSEQTLRQKFKLNDYLKITGYISTLYDYNQQLQNNGTLDQSSVFQVRRARLDIKGNVHPKIDFRLQLDFANSPKIVDAFVRLKLCKYANFIVGQTKTPFTIENAYSSLDIELMTNAQVVSALAGIKDVSGVSRFALGAEIGIQLYGTLFEFTRNDKKYPLLSYAIGLLGGNGVNINTDNMAKDLVGTLYFRPFVKDLTLVGSVYWGRYDNEHLNNLLRLRYTGGVEYKNERLTLRSEYIWGETGLCQASNDAIPQFHETRLKTNGFYFLAGYWFNFGWGKNDKYNIQQKLRPVVRYDYYHKDLSIEKGASTYYCFGVDWWPEQHLNVRVNYILKDIQANNQLGHGFSTMLTVKF